MSRDNCGFTAQYIVAPLVSSGSVPGAAIAESGTAADMGVMTARAYDAPAIRGLDQSSPKTSPRADPCGPFDNVAVAVARPNAARGPAA